MKQLMLCASGVAALVPVWVAAAEPAPFPKFRVQEIDKSNGMPVGSKMNLGNSGLGGNINDWAFAQWGGKFYLFVTTTDGLSQNSTVRTIDRSNGNYAVALQNLPYFIDGAGVSTCAPIAVQ